MIYNSPYNFYKFLQDHTQKFKITLVTMTMLLQLYYGIFRTLSYLMSEPSQTSKVLRDVENPNIVKTVYSGIFR